METSTYTDIETKTCISLVNYKGVGKTVPFGRRLRASTEIAITKAIRDSPFSILKLFAAIVCKFLMHNCNRCIA